MPKLQMKEDSVGRITGTMVDEAGATVADTDLTSLKLWLYDHLGAIINSRTAANILNTGGGTLDSSGSFVLTLEAADNPIVGPKTKGTKELHKALIQATWVTPANRKTWFELPIEVINLEFAPA